MVRDWPPRIWELIVLACFILSVGLLAVSWLVLHRVVFSTAIATVSTGLSLLMLRLSRRTRSAV